MRDFDQWAEGVEVRLKRLEDDVEELSLEAEPKQSDGRHYLGRYWTVFDNTKAKNSDGCDWWVVPDGETDPRVCKCPRKQDAEEIARRLNGE